jgi:hypothetical protein
MMKTQNPYSTVILIQMSKLKTQELDDDDYYDEEEQSSPPVQWKQIKSGDCSLRLTIHMSFNLQVVTQEKSRIKHHI